MVTPEFEEWLRTTEIPVDERTDLETYIEYLRDELGISGDSLKIAATVFSRDLARLEEYRIRGVIIEYPWGRQFRYGIQGLPGLWGWATVRAIREEEEW